MSQDAEPRPPFSNILCPIDFSDPSRAALRLAGELAKDWAVRIIVLYVHDPTTAGIEAVAFPDVSLDDLRSEIHNFAAKVLHAGRASVPTTKYVATIGNPAREIDKAAEALAADLVVIGTQGLSGAGKLFFGSTTQHLVRQAACPVLTLKTD